MRTFVIACLAAVVMAVAAVYVLDAYQQTTEVAFASPTGVRL